jgi:hypothetical protein
VFDSKIVVCLVGGFCANREKIQLFIFRIPHHAGGNRQQFYCAQKMRINLQDEAEKISSAVLTPLKGPSSVVKCSDTGIRCGQRDGDTSWTTTP